MWRLSDCFFCFQRGRRVPQRNLDGVELNIQGHLKIAPPNYFKVGRYPLHGFAIPTTNESLKALEALNVGLIVCTLLEPIHPRRNFNFRTTGSKAPDDTEWVNVDDDIWSGITMNRLHIPIHDGHAPTERQVKTFCEMAVEAIDDHKEIAVHCWEGKGRTGTMLAIALMMLWGLDADTAIKMERYPAPEAVVEPAVRHRLGAREHMTWEWESTDIENWTLSPAWNVNKGKSKTNKRWTKRLGLKDKSSASGTEEESASLMADDSQTQSASTSVSVPGPQGPPVSAPTGAGPSNAT